MKIKTPELTGAALDWAVAQCVGAMYCLEESPLREPWESMANFNARYAEWKGDGFSMEQPAFSTDWAQGGQIIERERIELCSYSNDGVDTAFRSKGDERGNYSHEEEYVISVPEVVTWTACKGHGSHQQDGPTPLIAAMRCFIASKLGDEVDVPGELK